MRPSAERRVLSDKALAEPRVARLGQFRRSMDAVLGVASPHGKHPAQVRSSRCRQGQGPRSRRPPTPEAEDSWEITVREPGIAGAGAGGRRFFGKTRPKRILIFFANLEVCQVSGERVQIRSAAGLPCEQNPVQPPGLGPAATSCRTTSKFSPLRIWTNGLSLQAPHCVSVSVSVSRGCNPAQTKGQVPRGQPDTTQINAAPQQGPRRCRAESEVTLPSKRR